jgi:hypothetical protein
MSMPGIGGGGAPLTQQQRDFLYTAQAADAGSRLQKALPMADFLRREYGANSTNMMRRMNPATQAQMANPYKTYDPQAFLTSPEYQAAQEYITGMGAVKGATPGRDIYGVYSTYGINAPGAQANPGYSQPQMDAINRAYEAYMARSVLGQKAMTAPTLPPQQQLETPVSRPAAAPMPRSTPLAVPQMRPAPAPAPRPQNMLMPAPGAMRGPAPVSVAAISGRTPSVQPPLMSRPAPRR